MDAQEGVVQDRWETAVTFYRRGKIFSQTPWDIHKTRGNDTVSTKAFLLDRWTFCCTFFPLCDGSTQQRKKTKTQNDTKWARDV